MLRLWPIGLVLAFAAFLMAALAVYAQLSDSHTADGVINAGPAEAPTPTPTVAPTSTPSPAVTPTATPTPAPTPTPFDPTHDAKVKTFGSGGEGFNVPNAGGSRSREVTFRVEGNHGPHADTTRGVIEVMGLPTNCTLANSGPDKVFGTGDDGPTVGSPGGLLFDDTRFYAAHQKVEFKFKMRLACAAPVPLGAIFSLRAVVDHGADDYPAADNDDAVPGNNVRTRFHKVK